MSGLNILKKAICLGIFLSILFHSYALCVEQVYDKYALINSKGQFVTSFEWDDISFSDGYIKVFKGKINGLGAPEEGKYGLLDNNGRTILDVEWDDLTEVESKTIGICKNGKWGCFDIEKNQIIIPLEYEDISPFSGNYAVACTDKRTNIYSDKRVYNFINRNNEIVYKGEFGLAHVYEDGIACVGDYVDVTGYNQEQRISANKNRKCHWININTKQVYPYESGRSSEYSEGLLSAYENGKYGCMDLTGKLIIPCEYDRCLSFENDRAVAKKNGHYYIINKKNEIVTALEFDYVSEIHNGRTYGFIGKVSEGGIPETGQYCIIDSNGQRLGPLHELDSVEEPDNGAWWVEKGGLYTIIDMTGNYVTNSVWKEIMMPTTSTGLKAVSNGEGYGVVDVKGNVIIDYTWDSIIHGQDDLFAVKRFQNNHDVWNADWGMTKNEIIQNEGNDYIYKTIEKYELLIYTRNRYGFDWSVYYYFMNDKLCNVTIGKINKDGMSTINDLEKLDKQFSEEYGKAAYMAGTATADQIDDLLKKVNSKEYEMFPLFSRGYFGHNASILLDTYRDKNVTITTVSYQEYNSDHEFEPLTASDLYSVETNTLFESNARISEEEVSLRKEPAFASDTICKLVNQQKIYIIEEVDKYVKWYHVRLDNGTTGYVLAVQVTAESNYQESKQDILLSNNSSNNSRQKPENKEVSISNGRFEGTEYGGRNFIDAKEVFTIRNGIKMGMTKDEIKKRESFPLERDTVARFIDFGPGEILGIPNSFVEYLFDDSGKLNTVHITLGKDIEINSSLYANYKKAIESLTQKYGQPLDLPSGKNYKYVTSLLETMLPWSLNLQKIAPTPYWYEYEEWALQYEAGLIKIECLYYYSKGKKGTTAWCLIEYKFFENKSDPALLKDNNPSQLSKQTNNILEYNARIKGKNVELSKKPSRVSDTICKLADNQKIYILGEVDENDKWYYVKVGNKMKGYVLAANVIHESN